MGDEFDTSEEISFDDATDDFQIFEEDNDIGDLMDDTDDFLPEPDFFDSDVESLLNNTEEGSAEQLEEILDSNIDIDGSVVDDSSLDLMLNAEIEEDGNIDDIMNEVTYDEDSLPDAAPYLSEIEALNNIDEGSAEQLEEIHTAEEGTAEQLEEILDSNTDINGNIVDDSNLDLMSNTEIEEDGNVGDIMNEVTQDEDSLPDAAPYLSEIETLNNTDEGTAEQLEEILTAEEGTAEQLEDILDSNTGIDGNIVENSDSDLIIAPEITRDGNTEETMYEVVDSENPALDLETSIQETTITGEEIDEQKSQFAGSTNANVTDDDNSLISNTGDNGSIETPSMSPIDINEGQTQGKKPGEILAAVTAGTSLLSGVTGYVDAYEELNKPQPDTVPTISYTQETNIPNLQDDLAAMGFEYENSEAKTQDIQPNDLEEALSIIDAGYIEPETIGEMKAEEHLKRIEEMSEEKQVFGTETPLEPPVPKTADNIDEEPITRSFKSDLQNPDLFLENEEGDYTYEKTKYGKKAYGVLINEKGERNLTAQKELDGKLKFDDAGHLIATRFNPSGDVENLEPMDRNLNRGSYKIRENSWANSLEEGDKVFVNTESFHGENRTRPEAFMGYSITEHPDGTRDGEVFSYQNESALVQAAQNEEVYKQNDLIDKYENPIDYNPEDFEEELKL